MSDGADIRTIDHGGSELVGSPGSGPAAGAVRATRLLAPVVTLDAHRRRRAHRRRGVRWSRARTTCERLGVAMSLGVLALGGLAVLGALAVLAARNVRIALIAGLPLALMLCIAIMWPVAGRILSPAPVTAPRARNGTRDA